MRRSLFSRKDNNMFKKLLNVLTIVICCVALVSGTFYINIYANDSTVYICDIEPGEYHNDELAIAVREAYASGERKIKIKPGTYRLYGNSYTLSGNRNAHFTLNNMSDFTLIGDGVKLIGCDPSDGLETTGGDKCIMYFYQCENFTVTGFSTDYENLSFTQGEVVAVENGAYDENYITIRIDEGYPDYLENREYFPSSVTGVIYDAKTKLPKEMGSTFNLSPVRIEGEERTFRCHNYNARTMKYFDVGDLVAIRMNHCSGMNTCFKECRNISLVNHTVYSGHYGVLNEPTMLRDENGGTDDRVYFKNVRVVKGERPEKATRDRLISTMADGIHNSYISGEILMEDCFVEGNMDDCFSLNGRHYMVTEATGKNNQYYMGGIAFAGIARKGDRFAIYDENSNYKGTVKAVSVETVSDYTPPDNANNINGLVFGGYVIVTFEDSDVDIQPKDFAFDIDASAGHYVMRNCTAQNSTGRGALLQAWNGLVENCSFEYVKGGIILTGEKNCAQGPYVSDVVVRGCSFKRCDMYEDVKEGRYIPSGAITTKIVESGRANANIVVDGCLFEDNYGSDIIMANTCGAVISNNIFGGRKKVEDCKARDGEASVRIENCEDVLFDDSNVFLTDRLPIVYQEVDRFASNFNMKYSSKFNLLSENSYDNEWCYEYVPIGTDEYSLYNHMYWAEGKWERIVPLWSQNSKTNIEYGYFESLYQMVPGSKNDIVATYNAPYTGKVKIIFNDGLYIDEETVYRSDGVGFKIIRNTDTVWPQNGEWYILNEPALNLDEIFVDVQKGDKIRLRVNNNSADGTGNMHDVLMFATEIRYVTETYERSEEVASNVEYIELDIGEEYTVQTDFQNPAWECNDTGIAVIDDSGIVAAEQVGVCTITATDNNRSKKYIVAVGKINDKIAAKQPFVSGVVGTSRAVKLSLPANASADDVIWSSSDDEVIDVAGDEVYFKKLGTAVLTAKYGNDECEILAYSSDKDLCLTPKVKLTCGSKDGKHTVMVNTGKYAVFKGLGAYLIMCDRQDGILKNVGLKNIILENNQKQELMFDFADTTATELYLWVKDSLKPISHQ